MPELGDRGRVGGEALVHHRRQRCCYGCRQRHPLLPQDSRSGSDDGFYRYAQQIQTLHQSQTLQVTAVLKHLFLSRHSGFRAVCEETLVSMGAGGFSCRGGRMGALLSLGALAADSSASGEPARGVRRQGMHGTRSMESRSFMAVITKSTHTAMGYMQAISFQKTVQCMSRESPRLQDVWATEEGGLSKTASP